MVHEIGDKFSMTITAPLNTIKAFIKSKWRNEGWKLISMSTSNDKTYILNFEVRKVYQRKTKLYPEKNNSNWIQ